MTLARDTPDASNDAMVDVLAGLLSLAIGGGVFVMLASSISRIDTWSLREAAIIGTALVGGSLAYVALLLVASPVAVASAWVTAIAVYVIGYRRWHIPR